MCIECLDKLILNFDNIVKYPVLGLYAKEPETFLDNYLLIVEDEQITICNRKTLEMIIIDFYSSFINLFPKKINHPKISKEKLFLLGN